MEGSFFDSGYYEGGEVERITAVTKVSYKNVSVKTIPANTGSVTMQYDGLVVMKVGGRNMRLYGTKSDGGYDLRDNRFLLGCWIYDPDGNLAATILDNVNCSGGASTSFSYSLKAGSRIVSGFNAYDRGGNQDWDVHGGLEGTIVYQW